MARDSDRALHAVRDREFYRTSFRPDRPKLGPFRPWFVPVRHNAISSAFVES